MNNWLVIGDTSFTGAALVEHLTRQGDVVTGASLRDHTAVEEIEKGYDYVVNFAALNVVAPSWEHPIDYFDVNVVAQIPVFEALAKVKPKKYVHISTPEVYGTNWGEIKETTRHAPSTPYATSRAAAEMLLRNYVNRYGIPACVTRGSNIYGPGQQLYRLIPKLVHTILSGDKFELEGGGQSQRGFIYVDDCIKAIELVAKSGEPGEAYHIADNSLLWIREVVREVCQQMDVSFSDVVTESPERPGKDPSYFLSNGKIRNLGWRAKVGFQEGVKRTIDWARKDWEKLKDQPTVYEMKL